MPAWQFQTAQDRAEALLGADNNNNTQATTNVAANADGSVLERVEYLQTLINLISSLSGSLPTHFVPGLGYRVTKVGDIAGTADNLFDVTGKVLVTLITGEVTSVFGTSTSMKLNTSTGSVNIVASTTVTTLPAGTLLLPTGDPDDGFNGGQTLNADVAMSKTGFFAPFMVNDDKIVQTVNATGTGLVEWTLHYIPLEASASVASSA